MITFGNLGEHMSSPIAIPFHMMKQTAGKERTSRPKAMDKITPITLKDRLRSLMKYERSLMQDQSTSIKLIPW